MSEQPRAKLRGRLHRLMYVDAKKGYSEGKIQPEGHTYVVGIIGDLADAEVGDEIVCHGLWKDDHTHGRHFLSQRCEIVSERESAPSRTEEGGIDEGGAVPPPWPPPAPPRVVPPPMRRDMPPVGTRPPALPPANATGADPSLWAVIKAHPTAKRIGGVLLACGVVLFLLAQCAQDLGIVDGFVRANLTWKGVPVCSLVDPSSKQEGNNGQTVSYTSSSQPAAIDACFRTAWQEEGLTFIDTSTDSSEGPLLTIRRWRKDNGLVYSYGYYFDKGRTHVILASR